MANEKKLDCVILGLLSHENLTGYEIKKRMDTVLHFFWGASYGSIYPTLKELESNGLASKTETKENGRRKAIYTITEEGRLYLKHWLQQPVEKDELRYETLLKLFFGDGSNPGTALGHIEEFEAKIEKELPYLLSSVKTLERIKDTEPAHTYYLLTARFGVTVYKAYLDWCHEVKKALGEKA